MQTNDELKIIVEDIAKEAFEKDWDQSVIKNKIAQKIFTDEDREWALGKVRLKKQHLIDLKSYKKSGRRKIFLGCLCLVLAVLISLFYRPALTRISTPLAFGIPYIFSLTLIWNGRNDLARY